eukprot:6514143-Pyramimonas_sp.AAC.2
MYFRSSTLCRTPFIPCLLTTCADSECTASLNLRSDRPHESAMRALAKKPEKRAINNKPES